MVFLFLFASIATGDQSSAFSNQLSAISFQQSAQIIQDG
jgi:hypothetical protein